LKIKGQPFVRKRDIKVKQILCEHIRAVEDSENRTLVYSLKSAAQNGKVFGQFRAVAPNGDKILVENESGVADIYDTSNLQALVRFLFPSRIVHARFASKRRHYPSSHR